MNSRHGDSGRICGPMHLERAAVAMNWWKLTFTALHLRGRSRYYLVVGSSSTKWWLRGWSRRWALLNVLRFGWSVTATL